MPGVIVACRLRVADCEVVVTVDAAGGDNRQTEVAAAIDAVATDIGLLTADALRAGWALVGDPTWQTTTASALVATPSPTQAWLDGNQKPDPQLQPTAPPPPPQTADVGPSLGQVLHSVVRCSRRNPSPPSPAVTAKALPAALTAVSAAPSARSAATASQDQSSAGAAAADADWDQRLAAAAAHGTEVAAAALRERRQPPWAPPLAPPLRNRVWAAVGDLPQHNGLYCLWEGAASVALQSGCVVRGFPSLAEARAFAKATGCDVPDRRR